MDSDKKTSSQTSVVADEKQKSTCLNEDGATVVNDGEKIDKLSKEERAKAKAAARIKQKKRAERAAFREKYFSYYDDVKTKIKEDW